jgi:hypothetical protein
MLRPMDDSKVHDIAEQRDFGELVTVGVIASNTSVVVLVASLIVPIGVAIAGFVSGQTLVGVLGIVGIPVVYLGMGRVIGRLSRGERVVYFLRRGVIVVDPKAGAPTPYAWSELKLTKREQSPSYTEMDVDTQMGERIITLNSSAHDVKLVEMTAEAAA